MTKKELSNVLFDLSMDIRTLSLEARRNDISKEAYDRKLSLIWEMAEQITKLSEKIR